MTEPEALVDAPVVEVTVLEDRARVVRRGAATLPAGQSRLVIDGVAPVLADKSLGAEVAGARVLDVRCERRRVAWSEGAAAEQARAAARLDAAEREARAELDCAEVAHAAARRDADLIAALRTAALRELAVDAAWGKAPSPGDTLDQLDARDRDAVARAVATAADLARVRRDVEALARRRELAAAAAGHEAARIVVDVHADGAGPAEVAVDYVVPGACWRPYHTATFDAAVGELEVATDACVWQSTGEDWRGARLAFSTERPSLGTEPPPLADDVVRVRRRSDVVVAETRDQDLDEVGLGVDRAARAAAEVPGVDDGGVTQLLRAEHPATVIADGRPFRVPLGAWRAPAEVARVAMPERSPCVFFRVRAGNAGGRPLLAGPVDLIMDAGYVGRTSILYVAPGERFTIGFGPDAELRVHRELERERDEAGLLGGRNVTTVRVAVRLSNLGDEARTVEVTERIPVSELADVEVELAAPDAWAPEPRGEQVPVVHARQLGDDGMVTWTVELPPYGRRLCALEYAIKSARRVVGI